MISYHDRPEAEEGEGDGRAAAVRPAVVEAVLLLLPQRLLVLGLVELPALLDEPEALQGDLLV